MISDKYKAPPEPKEFKDGLNQAEKFKAAARALETDDDEKRFDKRLGKIAKTKPEKEKPAN